jgi:hypothetical protein
LPFLEYCSSVWSSAANCHLILLDSVIARSRYFFSELGIYIVLITEDRLFLFV